MMYTQNLKKFKFAKAFSSIAPPPVTASKKVKFAEAFSVDSPPKSKRKKTGPGQQLTAEDWQKWRPRIEALYRGHELKIVKETLVAEGFHASAKQIVTRLEEWGGNSKYLKLTDRQWMHIAQRIAARSSLDPESKTAVRWKDTKEIIPASKLKKGLERRLARQDFLDVISECGTVSSHGLSTYTSSTSGFKVKEELHGFLNELGSEISDAKSVDSEVKPRPLGPRTGRSPPSPAAIVQELQMKYPYDRFSCNEQRYGDAFTCSDCPDYEWNPPTDIAQRPLAGGDPLARISALCESLRENLKSFERRHLLNEGHRRRVQRRLQRYFEAQQASGAFAPQCKHMHGASPQAPSEKGWECFIPGGCSWEIPFRNLSEDMEDKEIRGYQGKTNQEQKEYAGDYEGFDRNGFNTAGLESELEGPIGYLLETRKGSWETNNNEATAEWTQGRKGSCAPIHGGSGSVDDHRAAHLGDLYPDEKSELVADEHLRPTSKAADDLLQSLFPELQLRIYGGPYDFEPGYYNLPDYAISSAPRPDVIEPVGGVSYLFNKLGQLN